MKNIKAIGLLVLALLIGLAAAVYATGLVTQSSSMASNKVVVAVIDIQPGTKVNAQMVSMLDWPSGSVPPGTFKDVKELQDRVAKVSLLRGEAVLEGKLAPVGTLGGLSAVIASGKRAMTVRVNDVVGVAGFALPGNYVDVLVNAQQDKGKNQEGLQISKTVLEHVLVLAVAQEAGRDDTKPRVVSAVTLELSIEDSEKLDLARSVGTLSLVLRNQVDMGKVTTAGVTKSQLFGETPLAPTPVAMTVKAWPVARARSSECVEVMHNSSLTVSCF